MTATLTDLNAQAWALRHSDVAKALELAERAKLEAEARHDNNGLAESLLTLSFCQMRRADYQLSVANAERAYRLFSSVGKPIGAQKALNTMGITHGQAGNLTGALETFLRAYKLCDQIDDKEAEANALNNLAIIYNAIGDYTSALDYYLRSLNLYRASSNVKGEVRALQNIGNVYVELGRFQDALEHYLRGLELQSPDDGHIYALTLANVGRAYFRLGDLERALAYEHDSLERMESLDDAADLSYVLDELGSMYRSKGDIAQAKRYHERSLRIKCEIGDLKGQAEAHLHLGTLYSHENNVEASRSALEMALKQADEVGAKAGVYRAHQQLAKLFHKTGDYQAAYRHLEHYTETREALFDEKFDQRFNALRVSFEVEQKEREKEIYRLRSVELAEANAKLHELTEKLEEQASRDALTSLYNRRYFDSELEQTFGDARQRSGQMSVMIGDIDNFKKVNDTFSHQVGDEVLVRVAELLRDNIRDVDTVARYGGEEFVVLFPDTSAAEAYRICDRVRAVIEAWPWFEIHPDLKVTMSMGLSDDLKADNGEKMVAKADDKLYESKRNGKNRVTL